MLSGYGAVAAEISRDVSTSLDMTKITTAMRWGLVSLELVEAISCR